MPFYFNFITVRYKVAMLFFEKQIISFVSDLNSTICVVFIIISHVAETIKNLLNFAQKIINY